MIPFWTETNPKTKNTLLPISEITWHHLTSADKKRMWKYLERHLFNPTPSSYANFDAVKCSYEFYGKDMWENDHLVKTVIQTALVLNERYKKASYAESYLDKKTYDAACYDFHRIFMEEPSDVVFEMITIFSRLMIIDDGDRVWKKTDETNEEFEKRKDEMQWNRFDAFSSRLSEVFEDFGINYKLTRVGFIPADEPVLVERIYEPALKKLSFKQWEAVNRDLNDAFTDLRDEDDGSGAITHVLSALQGFLQIIVHGKTGKGDTSDLISEALKRKLIPSDNFSGKMVKEMVSFWARERKERGDPHPKDSYATKNQAKLVVNLVMTFIDHVL